jgi:hypothetical protein
MRSDPVWELYAEWVDTLGDRQESRRFFATKQDAVKIAGLLDELAINIELEWHVTQVEAYPSFNRDRPFQDKPDPEKIAKTIAFEWGISEIE